MARRRLYYLGHSKVEILLARAESEPVGLPSRWSGEERLRSCLPRDGALCAGQVIVLHEKRAVPARLVRNRAVKEGAELLSR